MDRRGHELLVRERRFQRVHMLLEHFVRLANCFKRHLDFVVLHVLDEQQCVVALFLCLYGKPVGEPLEALLFIIVGKVQI
ncbi:hypothetical protein SDC9_132726 [bioreactor metagenome]|uniref:Uncharacterized protein n=1 Tax=bioreactor metagenome TaxID=1076179 RepID=A0A645D8W4_9ZZZZ